MYRPARRRLAAILFLSCMMVSLATSPVSSTHLEMLEKTRSSPSRNLKVGNYVIIRRFSLILFFLFLHYLVDRKSSSVRSWKITAPLRELSLVVM